MVSVAPIGVFDSGLGGISVVREMRLLMPSERIIYFGDSANAPYGTKTPQQVRELSFRIVKRFAQEQVKAIVIACNTATSAAVNDLRKMYDFPIVSMEPALKPACDRGNGKGQRIIVAATELTLRERKFSDLMRRFEDDNTIYRQPCPKLVEVVERGLIDDYDLVMATLHEYFDRYDLASVDSVVLGCTHFVFYRDYFKELLPQRTAIIDGNEGTARHLRNLLGTRNELAPPETKGSVILRNSDSSERMRELSQRMLDR